MTEKLHSGGLPATRKKYTPAFKAECVRQVAAGARQSDVARVQGKHIGRPKGLDAANLAKVREAMEKGLFVAETVELTGISLSSVKRYRKHLREAMSN